MRWLYFASVVGVALLLAFAGLASRYYDDRRHGRPTEEDGPA